MNRTPLVSCVMATYNRRRFASLALRWWMRQTYQPRQLIVVDDGEDCIRDLLPSRDASVVYVRLNRRAAIGEKFNLAIDGYAQGDLIALWADDDWQRQDRLSMQAAALALAPGAQICGIDRMWWWDGRADWLWRYEYEPRRKSISYLIGGSFFFRKAWWRERPFVEQRGVSEDNAFIQGRLDGETGVNLDDIDWYVGMIHNANTSPKHPEMGADQWRRWTVSPHELMGADVADMRRTTQ